MKRVLVRIAICLMLGVFATGCSMFGRKETVMNISQVPAPVRTSIEKVTAGAKIKQIEKIESGDKVTYEVEYIRDGKELDAYIDPDGKVIKGG
jgi:hypothetical protein